MPASTIFSSITKGLQDKENRELMQLKKQQAFNVLGNDRKKALFQDANQALIMGKGGNFSGMESLLNERVQMLDSIGPDGNPVGDSSDTREILSDLLNDPDKAINKLELVRQAGIENGFLTDVNLERKRVNKIPAGQAEFEHLIAIAQDPNSTELEKNSAKRKLGAMARVSSSAKERIAQDPNLTNLVAGSEGTIAGGKESAKLQAQLKFKPQIQSAVKLAESQAKERGETLTDLQRLEASLPSLMEATGQLKELAKISTSTFGGRIFDAAVKETGFGSTKGSTARIKFIAIIDNQVLPLLKQTFGAAFTVPEGESLKRTMGDPNATTDEKLAQIDAFIEQKTRTIQSKKLQLGQQPAANQDQGQIMVDAQGNRAKVFEDGRVEEL